MMARPTSMSRPCSSTLVSGRLKICLLFVNLTTLFPGYRASRIWYSSIGNRQDLGLTSINLRANAKAMVPPMSAKVHARTKAFLRQMLTAEFLLAKRLKDDKTPAVKALLRKYGGSEDVIVKRLQAQYLAYSNLDPPFDHVEFLADDNTLLWWEDRISTSADVLAVRWLCAPFDP